MMSFYGDENDNPVEFPRQCKKTVETIGNHLTYQDKINFVAKYCRNSEAEWYTVIRDEVTTYEDFVHAFEATKWDVFREWNFLTKLI